MLTTEVENFPGFPEGIMGPELMMRFREQAERFGAQFLTEKVTAVDFSERPFRVWVRDQEFTADSIIVSTGAQSLMLGLEAESHLLGHGLSTCADMRRVLLPRSGDRRRRRRATPPSRRRRSSPSSRPRSSSCTVATQLRASKIMQERALNNPKIEMLWNSAVEDLVGTDKLEGAVVRNLVTNEVSTLPVTGLFVAIGHRPNTDLFKGVLDMGGQRLLDHQAGQLVHQRRRRVRLRRCAGPHLPPGHHRRRFGLHRSDRLRALAGSQPARRSLIRPAASVGQSPGGMRSPVAVLERR